MSTWEEYKKTMVGESSVFEDARLGNCEALIDYLKGKGNVEARNHRGYSLLMLAAYNEQIEAARILIEHGADVNSSDHGGNTVLMGASFKGLKDMVHLLLQNGADPTLKNDHGMTAVDFANIFGRRDVIKLLSSE